MKAPDWTIAVDIATSTDGTRFGMIRRMSLNADSAGIRMVEPTCSVYKGRRSLGSDTSSRDCT